jgi:hypothetical protein
MKLINFMIFSSLASATVANNDGLALNSTYNSANLAESFDTLFHWGFELNPVYKTDNHIGTGRKPIRNASLTPQRIDDDKSKISDFFPCYQDTRELTTPLLDDSLGKYLGRKWVP